LYHNQLTSFSPDVINLNSNIDYLDLSFNKLARLDSSMFEGLIKLESLGLEENEISEIDRNTFIELDQLSTVCFKSNPVVSLFPHSVQLAVCGHRPQSCNVKTDETCCHLESFGPDRCYLF